MRANEKALANGRSIQRRDVAWRTSASAQGDFPMPAQKLSISFKLSDTLAALFFSGLRETMSREIQSTKLSLTPQHLFYLLSRLEGELDIDVGPMNVRLENLHHNSSSAKYVSFLKDTRQVKITSCSISSQSLVHSMRRALSGMSPPWAGFGMRAGYSTASCATAGADDGKMEVQDDLKYLYSAFTKIPCLRLAPNWRAHLVRGYEEFPFDSAVPLYAFKNLQALEVQGVDFRQFFGWDRLADQLRSLSLSHAEVNDPADVLIDILLDDMSKKRRRASKSQSSSLAISSANQSFSWSSKELQVTSSRKTSVYGLPDVWGDLAESCVDGCLAQSEPATEDTYTQRARYDNTDQSSQFSAQSSPVQKNLLDNLETCKDRFPRRQSTKRIRRPSSQNSRSNCPNFPVTPPHRTSASSSGESAMDILPPSKWHRLRHLSLADNAMTSISRIGLAPLADTLVSLDLSSNLFRQVPSSLSTLTQLRALNLSLCEIDCLHSITEQPLPAITTLNLRANRLQTLAGIEEIYSLKRLDVRQNRLTDPLELARLTRISDLQEIWVEGNPFTQSQKDYRVIVFSLFRSTLEHTMDLTIDGSSPCKSERRRLAKRAPEPNCQT